MAALVLLVLALLVAAGGLRGAAWWRARRAIPWNVDKHLTNEHHYAHFSGIGVRNPWLFPELLRTSPVEFTVRAGQSIWIPRRWWHWVTSTTPTLAVNFLTRTPPPHMQSVHEPRVFASSFQDNRRLLSIVARYPGAVITVRPVAHHHVCEQVPRVMAGPDSRFVITLKGYGADHFQSLNQELLTAMKPWIWTPPLLRGLPTQDVDTNVWYASGDHDTGLHYDDDDVLLCVVAGRKHIVLYPPSDSRFLRPLCVVPAWAKVPAVQFRYNTNEYLRELPSTTWPSARLLYEFVHCYGNKPMLLKITEAVARAGGAGHLVYGCKQGPGDTMRVELYSYHFHPQFPTRPLAFRRLAPNGVPAVDLATERRGCILHSVDLRGADPVVGPAVHFYYREQPTLYLPLFGRGTEATAAGGEHPESRFVVDTATAVQARFVEYMARLQFTDVPAAWRPLLTRYAATYLCIHNKFTGQLFLQFLGITFDDFVHVLEEHGYPVVFVEHVKAHRDQYVDLIHEVTLVYDARGAPVRTAFYGLV